MVAKLQSLSEDVGFVIFASLMWPGIVQLVRGRLLPGLVFTLSAATLTVAGFVAPDQRTLLWACALAIAAISIIDALRVRSTQLGSASVR